jgi:hypothetical protein
MSFQQLTLSAVISLEFQFSEGKIGTPIVPCFEELYL